MSLYGISRLLRSRKLGPSQLMPSIVSFHAEAREKHEQSLEIYGQLRELAKERAPDLEPTIRVLEALAEPLGERMEALFGRVRKLGASERLALERGVVELGNEVQALRALVELVRASLLPRATSFTLSQILSGKWRPRHTFVESRAELNIGRDRETPFIADPRVLSILVEHSLGRVAAAGVRHPFATVEDRDGCFGIALGDVDIPAGVTVERFVIELRPRLPIEDEVVAAVRRQLRCEAVEYSGGMRVCIPLQVA